MMKQVNVLSFFLVVLTMLLATGCAKSSASDTITADSPEPTVLAEEVVVSVDYATDELLNRYDVFDEFVEFEEEGYQKIVFTTSTAVRDFRFIEVGHKEEGTNVIFFENAVLHSLDELLPEKPFVVTWMEQGLIPHRGITFVDENNTTRYFCIVMSGKDGSLSLSEFQQA